MEINPASGALTQRELISNDSNPACLALAPSGAHLYSANEISNYSGAVLASVSAYAIDHTTGHLTLLNTASPKGPDRRI